jgi:hypothetical protein
LPGAHSDGKHIAELINASPDLADRIRTLAAINSHAWSLPEHLLFQAEYRPSSNPEAVIVKYSHLFWRQEPHTFSVRFQDCHDMVIIDGKEWMDRIFHKY